MRRYELTALQVDHLTEEGNVIVVQVPGAKWGRTFTIVNPAYVEIYRKYRAIRPENMINPRLFLRYANGKCNGQVVGVHKIGEIPQIVAKYLNLENPNSYNGHAFRRSSAASPSIRY